jgi:hypothetical protein
MRTCKIIYPIITVLRKHDVNNVYFCVIGTLCDISLVLAIRQAIKNGHATQEEDGSFPPSEKREMVHAANLALPDMIPV